MTELDGLELHRQVRNIADVATAMASGDLSKRSPWMSRAKSLN